MSQSEHTGRETTPQPVEEKREYYEVDLTRFGPRPQAWDVAEAVVEALDIPFGAGHPLAISIEYIVRAGRKKPDTLKKDLVKARNALDRCIRKLG